MASVAGRGPSTPGLPASSWAISAQLRGPSRSPPARRRRPLLLACSPRTPRCTNRPPAATCKSNRDDGSGRKDPPDWKEQIRKDLDPPPRVVNGRTGKPTPNAEEIARDGKRPPPKPLLRALAEGGEFRVLVNVSPGPGPAEDFERELTSLFGFWIRWLLGREPPERLHRRIRVLGAHEVADAFNDHPFMLSGELQRRLELAEPAFLLDYGRWTEIFEHERRFMDYRADQIREDTLTFLDDFLTSVSVDEIG